MKPIGLTWVILVWTLVITGGEPMSERMAQHLPQVTKETLKSYVRLHQQPELSGQETQTAAFFAEALRLKGFKIIENIGGTGLVGILENGPGKVLMIRADLDALPMTEETGLPYASQVRVQDKEGRSIGVMHACGHDMHLAVALGTATLMETLKAHWQGTLIILGQPAEEIGAGSKAMLDDGLFKKIPLPDAILAQHVHPLLAAGTVGLTEAFCFANVDTVTIQVHGKGGHGAMPHECIDPVVMASQLVLSLQTIVSRGMDPTDPAVITVGRIQGGTKSNIIPDLVTLELTVRSMSTESRQRLLQAIEQKSKAIGMDAGLPPEAWPTVAISEEHVPSVYNDPDLIQLLAKVFTRELGEDQVISLKPEMIGEDFSRFGRTEHRIPIAMFRLGAAKKEAFVAYQKGEMTLPGLHNAKFSPDPEPTLATGIRVMSAAAITLLQKP
jgi:hippurate hydrolase